MWFVDHAQITVKAGEGGRGCAAFAQPPHIRFPSPDGGDGGDGGHVIIRAEPNLATLLDFHFRHEFAAGRGSHGGSNTKTGKRGEDLIIRVPVGTVIRESGEGSVLADLTVAGSSVTVARGGRGGLGNATLAAASHLIGQRPKRPMRPSKVRKAARVRGRSVLADGAAAMQPTPGEQRRLTLELKLIADVGIIGIPNAGKSSLLSRMSTARPKIGAYPFTTRYPVLGVVEIPQRGSCVACDIPGLIEGAHRGRGLGSQFLRHIERTRLLIHVVDMAAVDGQDPLEAFHQVNAELKAYSRALASRPQVVVANKMDLPRAAAHLRTFRRTIGKGIGTIWPISCVTGAGIPELLRDVWTQLQRCG